MSHPLILPKHVAANVAANARTKREAAVADSITKSTTNHMTSDDFVTQADVAAQLQELEAYIGERREMEPEYCLPTAIGWRLMVLMLTIPEKSAGGVFVVDEMREARSMSSPQGVVLGVGPAAYQDRSRFALDGELQQWVEEGDRVFWKKYDVTTFQIANGQRIGFMNDTQPVGVIDRGWIKKETT